jgi:hypothetical protein
MITIPEDLNYVEAAAYHVGMQSLMDLCHQTAEEIFPLDPSVDWWESYQIGMQSDDLANEMFQTFADLADQRIRYAMETMAIHGGYVTTLSFQQAAKRSIITMVYLLTLKNMLTMKEDELVNG